MSHTSSSERSRRWVLEGRVQGVGFRYWTLRQARGLGLRGHVRNLPDGSVEVVAAGPDEAMGELEESLRDGPPSARVTGVRGRDVDAPDRSTFEVEH